MKTFHNFRFFWSAEFLATDYNILVATLKLLIESWRISEFRSYVLLGEKLKALACAQVCNDNIKTGHVLNAPEEFVEM